MNKMTNFLPVGLIVGVVAFLLMCVLVASLAPPPPHHLQGAGASIPPRIVRWYVAAEPSGTYMARELPKTHVAPGQPVVFHWTGRQTHGHTVHQFPDQDAYRRCDFDRATQLPVSKRRVTGNGTEIIWPGTKTPGLYYFGCRVRNHCGQGMRIILQIT